MLRHRAHNTGGAQLGPEGGSRTSQREAISIVEDPAIPEARHSMARNIEGHHSLMVSMAVVRPIGYLLVATVVT